MDVVRSDGLEDGGDVAGTGGQERNSEQGNVNKENEQSSSSLSSRAAFSSSDTDNHSDEDDTVQHVEKRRKMSSDVKEVCSTSESVEAIKEENSFLRRRLSFVDEQIKTWSNILYMAGNAVGTLSSTLSDSTVSTVRESSMTSGVTGGGRGSGTDDGSDGTEKKSSDLFKIVVRIIGGMGLLSRRELVSYRLICRDMKQAVDSYWSEHPDHFKLHNAVAYPKFNCLSIHRGLLPRARAFFADPCTEPRYYKPLEQLLIDFPQQATDHPHPNPFPSRHLILNLQITSTQLQCIRFRYVFAGVLTRFGKEIWYLSVHGTNSKFLNLYESLCDWVQLMPNLKVLVLDCDWKDEKCISLLHKSVKNRKFPKLENLKVFQAINVVPLVHAVLETNSHIEKLAILKASVRNAVTDPWLLHDYNNFTLPNLIDLSVQVVTWADEEMVSNFQFPKLQHLNIFLYAGDQMKLLKNFESVRFLRTNYFDHTVRKEMKFDFPQLEELEIRDWNLEAEPQLKLDWLLSLNSLNYLKIAVTQTSLNCGQHGIDYTRFFNRFVNTGSVKTLAALKAVDVIFRGARHRILMTPSSSQTDTTTTNQPTN